MGTPGPWAPRLTGAKEAGHGPCCSVTPRTPSAGPPGGERGSAQLLRSVFTLTHPLLNLWGQQVRISGADTEVELG